MATALDLVRARVRPRPPARPPVLAPLAPGPAVPDAVPAPSVWSRLLLGLVAGAAVLGLLVTSLGLLSGPSVGAADNGDGYRLFCSAGLIPSTPDGFAIWRGAVVTEFATGADPCTGTPSSAAVVLGAAVPDGAPTFSLTRLGLAYAVLLAAGTTIAAVAASAAARRRAAVLLVPLLPLVVAPWWSRFFVSTYFEPAGLLGTAWMVLGLGAVAVTRPAHRWPRLAALALVALGGVVAATAKPGYAPVALAAALACACVVVGGRARLAGPLVACAMVAAAAGPVVTAVQWQDANYAAINTHNLVFTAVLPEVGPGATAAVGLPAAAYGRAGEGFYVMAAAGIPGWSQAIAGRPTEARSAARAELLAHPGAAARILGHGLVATLRPQLPYLPSAPRGTVPETNEIRTVQPEAGPFTPLLQAYLAGVTLPRLPGALVALALAAGAASLVPSWRRRWPVPAHLAQVSALTAGTGLALVAVAVIGDGYYELTKHVWLASYCLLVAALALGAALMAGVAALIARRAA